MSKQAKTFSVKFVEVLTARNAEQFSKDTQTALNNAQAGSAAIDLVMSKPEFAEHAKDLLKKTRIADHKQDKANWGAGGGGGGGGAAGGARGRGRGGGGGPD